MAHFSGSFWPSVGPRLLLPSSVSLSHRHPLALPPITPRPISISDTFVVSSIDHISNRKRRQHLEHRSLRGRKMASCAPSSWFLYRERCCRDRRQQQQQLSSSGGGFLISSASGGALGVSRSSSRGEKGSRGEVKVGAFWQDVSRPTSPVQLEAIAGMEDLDRLLEQAREMDQAVVIDWMAAWCRKCIYLKPKLEKLAAEFYPRVKFYCVDVNKVPQALVKRGNISKMPTIQLWKDGECKEEVIGGHKAWLVVEEVREMVQKYL